MSMEGPERDVTLSFSSLCLDARCWTQRGAERVWRVVVPKRCVPCHVMSSRAQLQRTKSAEMSLIKMFYWTIHFQTFYNDNLMQLKKLLTTLFSENLFFFSFSKSRPPFISTNVAFGTVTPFPSSSSNNLIRSRTQPVSLYRFKRNSIPSSNVLNQ